MVYKMTNNSGYLLDDLHTVLSNRPGGARIGAKIPDWMSNNLAGREK